MSGSVSMAPKSMPCDLAQENMLFENLSGPVAANTPSPPDVWLYLLARFVNVPFVLEFLRLYLYCRVVCIWRCGDANGDCG